MDPAVLSISHRIPEDEIPEKKLLLEIPIAKPKSKWKPVFQLLVLAFVYMIGYSPFNALWNLEGILFPEYGFYALMCNYIGSYFIFFVGPFFTRTFGTKGSVLLGWVGQAVFVSAHYFQEPYILLPVSVLVGAVHIQTTATIGVFITHQALQYADVTGQSKEHVLSLFQGAFYSLYLTCGIWSNLISSLVLIKPNDPNDGLNSTSGLDAHHNLTDLCGPAFCPWEDTSGTYITRPEQYIVHILLGAYIGMTGFAFLCALIFLENVKPSTNDAVQSALRFGGKVLSLLWRKKVFVLLPAISIYGVSQYFMNTEFSKAFVSCNLGIEYNGWAMICFAAGDILGSLVNGRLTKYVGMTALLVTATCGELGCLFSMLFFEASRDTVEYFFLVPFAFGLTDSVWMVQISAFIGHEFPDETWPMFIIFRTTIYGICAILLGVTNFVCIKEMCFANIALFSFGLLSFISYKCIRDRQEK